MEKTAIPFKKSHLILPFATGGATVICGLVSTIYGPISGVGLVGIGGMWIGIALHKYFSGYITLGHNFLQINDSPFVKKIHFPDIREIRFFAGDWIVKYGRDNEIYVNPNLADPESAPLLEHFFKRLKPELPNETT